MKYEVDRELLVELSKKIYEEACLGYMDLKDAVCERLVEEFISQIPEKDVKKVDQTTILSYTNDLNFMVGGVTSTSYNNYVIGVADITLRNVDEAMLNYRGNESERM